MAGFIGLALVTPTLHAQETRPDAPKEARKFKPLDQLFLTDTFWKLPKADFATTMREYAFVWISADETDARASQPNMEFAGLPVVEANLRFTPEGVPAAAVVSLFTRGDSRGLSKEEFGKLLQTTQDKLIERLGSKPSQIPGDNNAAVPINTQEWKQPTGRVRLEWSFTREVRTRNEPFRAEFVRLQFLPVEETKSLVQEGLKRADSAKKETIERVPVKEPNGDVWLNGVPMVDQGKKGYCVVASAERVLRYYGKEVDQHQLAQLADTSAKQGTSSDAMVKALKSLTQRFMIKVRTDMDLIDYRKFTNMVEDYNREAKRDKKREIFLSQSSISVEQVYSQMEPETLKTARSKSRSDFTRWQTDIKGNVNKGTPVLWTVIVGLYPETNLNIQGHGGHMRLILGYNEKDQTIIYSDSWGMGHERKILPMDQAFAMTTGLYTVEPL